MSLYELERSGDVDELLGYLANASDERVRARAATHLGAVVEPGSRERIVDGLVEAAREDAPDVAAAAVDALDEIGDEALEALIVAETGVDAAGADWVKADAFQNCLDHDAGPVRMAAANALGQVGGPEVLPALTESLDDPDRRVRARAARACGEIGDPRATGPLANRLEDTSPAVRRAAADALGAVGTREALEALLTLYDDEDERVRRIAVGGFGSFENDRPVPALVEALADEAAAVRRTAVYSLVELLSNVPTDRSHEIRETVVDELAAEDDPTVVASLVEILAESTQAPQKRNTAWLLGRVAGDDPDEDVQQVLLAALADDDEMVRQFAATSLAELGGSSVEADLIDVATDERRDPAVRGQAVFALGKVGGEDARRALDELLETTDEERLRERAFSAISKVGGRL